MYILEGFGVLFRDHIFPHASRRIGGSMKFSSLAIIKLCGLLLITVAADGQTLSCNNWYFGDGPNGLRFTRVTNAPSVVTNKTNPFGAGGSSVASDHDNAN